MEFKDQNGNVVNIVSNEHYLVRLHWIGERNNLETELEGVRSHTWTGPTSGGGSGGSVAPTACWGNAWFGKDELNCYVYVPKDVTGLTIPDNPKSSQFSFQVTKMTGEVVTLTNNTMTKADYTDSRGYNLKFPITAEQFPQCYYKNFSLLYNGGPVLDADGKNVAAKDRAILHSIRPSAYFREADLDRIKRANKVVLRDFDLFPSEVQLLLFAEDNQGATPDYTLSLTRDVNATDVYPIQDNGLSIDWSRRYRDILMVNGTALQTQDSQYYTTEQSDAQQLSYNVTVTQPAGGTLRAEKTSAEKWSNIYVFATPNAGMQMKPGSLQVNGKAVSGHSFLLLENTTITAEFEPMPVLSYGIMKNQNMSGGTVTVQETAIPGETVTVTATPDQDRKLTRLWYNKTNSGEEIVISLETMRFIMPQQPVNICATFDRKQSSHIYIDQSIVYGSVNVDGDTSRMEGDSVTLTVSPNEGEMLENLYYCKYNDTAASRVNISKNSEGKYSFVMPSFTIQVYATFLGKPYYAIVQDTSSINGKLTPNPTQAIEGTHIIVTVQPNEGYRTVENTVGYRENGTGNLIPLQKQVPIAPPAGGTVVTDTRFFTMPATPVTLYATFEKIPHYPVNIADGVPEKTLMVLPVLVQPKDGYVAGTDVMVMVQPQPGYRMVPNTLTCKLDSDNSEVPVLPQSNATDTPVRIYHFTMPAGAVTLNVTFEPLPTQPITMVQVNNGTITASHTAAAKDVPVIVTLQPALGYQVKECRYRIVGSDIFQRLTAIEGSNQYQFIMPDGAVEISAQFEKAMVQILLADNRFPIDSDRWQMKLIVPPYLQNQVNALNSGEGRYIETKIWDNSGNIVLNQVNQKNVYFQPAGQPIRYNLYKTPMLTAGTYHIALAVGDRSRRIELGQQRVTFGDFFAVRSLRLVDRNFLTTDSKAFSAILSIDSQLASHEDVRVELVRRTYNQGSTSTMVETIVATGVAKILFGGASEKDKGPESVTDFKYDFNIPAGETLPVGSYALRVTHKNQVSVVYDDEKLRCFEVENKPLVMRPEYDSVREVITFSLENVPAGSYAVRHEVANAVNQWLTMESDGKGHGTLDVSFATDVKNYPRFEIHNTAEQNVYAELLETVDLNLLGADQSYVQATIENALNIGGTWHLPLSTTAVSVKTGVAAPGTCKITYQDGSNVDQAKTIRFEDISNFVITSSDITFIPGVHYDLCIQGAQVTADASFKFTDQPMLNVGWYDAIAYGGDKLSLPIGGVLNLTTEQLQAVRFSRLSGKEEVPVPVLSITPERAVLNMAGVPDGLIELYAELPVAGGKPLHVQLGDSDLSVYRAKSVPGPEIAPITVTESSGTFTMNISYLNDVMPTADVTAHIYAAGGDMITLSKVINIGKGNATVTSTELGGQGAYILYFMMGETMLGMRRVQLGTAYTIKFLDWDEKTVLKTESVNFGQTVVPPTDPTRAEYTFRGWNGKYTNIDADRTVVAQYTEDRVTVTYDANYPNSPSVTNGTETVDYGAALTASPEVTRENYTLDGWFTAPQGGAKWTFGSGSYPVKSDRTLYAHWVGAEYDVTVPRDIPFGKIDCNTWYHAGDKVSVYVSAYDGYHVDETALGYKINNTGELVKFGQETTNGMVTYYFTMPASPVTLYASFIQSVSHQVIIDSTVPAGALFVVPVSTSPSGDANNIQYEGARVTVFVKPPQGKQLVAGSLTYSLKSSPAVAVPLTTESGATAGDMKYYFIMPTEDVTLTAKFEDCQPHTITVAGGLTNGTITLGAQSAVAGTMVFVTPVPAAGYQAYKCYYTYEQDGKTYSEPLNEAGSRGHQFMMPNVAVTVSAEFEKVAEAKMLRENRFSLNSDQWSVHYKIPQELQNQIPSANNQGRFVETIIWNESGALVLKQIDDTNVNFDVGNDSQYNLYKTEALQAGIYRIMLTVGDQSTRIVLGQQEVRFGDFLEVRNLWQMGGELTTDSKVCSAGVSVTGPLASPADLNVTLVRIDYTTSIGPGGEIISTPTETVVATGVGRYQLYDDAASGTTTPVAGKKNDSDYMSGTKLIYDFALLEKALEVGKEYALRAKHKTKETLYVNFNDNKLPVTDQPQIRSYEYDADSKIFTLQLECCKAGNYPTSYYLNGSTLCWINMVADAQGHGTLDVSAVSDLKANMSFTIYAGKHVNGYGEGCIGSVSVPAAVPQVNRNLSITSPGALEYYGQIGTDWVEWLLPTSVKAPQFSLENTTGAGTWTLTSSGNGATAASQTGNISDVSSFT
ncbi:MAG: InlB B-repeat-containing protein, partial [Oscillospiraceae bacterium]